MSVADPRVVVRKTLAAYFTPLLVGVTVDDNWPTPAMKIKMPALTVLASPNVKTEWHQPRLWRVTPAGINKGQALYSYGKAEINLQVDCWEQFEATRDILSQRVEAVMHRPPDQTLPGGSGLKDYTNAPGLVLELPGYYGTRCEYVFEAVASKLPEDNTQAQAGEWRQTWIGRATFYVCNEDLVPLLKTATAALVLNGNTDFLPVAQ